MSIHNNELYASPFLRFLPVLLCIDIEIYAFAQRTRWGIYFGLEWSTEILVRLPARFFERIRGWLGVVWMVEI